MMAEITTTLKFPKGRRQEKEAGSVPEFADDSRNDPDLVLPALTDSAFICGVSIINNHPCLCISWKEYGEGGFEFICRCMKDFQDF